MSQKLITSQSEFDELCDLIEKEKFVCFDTEFVSEFTYRPELCLLQYAAGERLVAVDPYEVQDLSRWWQIMLNPDITVVVHGGREEILFCLNEADESPNSIFDVQIAQGMLSRGYPLSLSALTQQTIGKRIHGRETRTDWRKRPLTKRQIDYALEDVIHLPQIYQQQQNQLESLGRAGWAEEECASFVNLLSHQSQNGEQWKKLPKLNKLTRRELALARDLYHWRDRMAEESNRPIRSILRDDLLIDLAHRFPQTESDITATRGIQRHDFRKHAPVILEMATRIKELPDSELPEKGGHFRTQSKQDEQVLGKILSIALANRCAEQNISLSLLATSSELRDFVVWQQKGAAGDAPRLMQGWRAKVCGQLMDQLLKGKIALRVGDPRSEAPLEFIDLET